MSLWPRKYRSATIAIEEHALMPHPSLLYHVAFTRDADTDRVVAEGPALDLADFGVDVPEALDRLQAMVSFHLDGLAQEGKSNPSRAEGGRRVLPAGAAPSSTSALTLA
jgi:hypothetical protein